MNILFSNFFVYIFTILAPPSDDSPSQVILPFSQENLTKSSQIQENDDFPENEFNFARKKDEASDLECEEVVQPVDRGFFIYDGELVDQYTAATTADLPDDEYSETEFDILYFYGNPFKSL
jgi:hypothetical protein